MDESVQIWASQIDLGDSGRLGEFLLVWMILAKSGRIWSRLDESLQVAESERGQASLCDSGRVWLCLDESRRV